MAFQVPPTQTGQRDDCRSEWRQSLAQSHSPTRKSHVTPRQGLLCLVSPISMATLLRAMSSERPSPLLSFGQALWQPGFPNRHPCQSNRREIHYSAHLREQTPATPLRPPSPSEPVSCLQPFRNIFYISGPAIVERGFATR